jgi:hypothetical protein
MRLCSLTFAIMLIACSSVFSQTEEADKESAVLGFSENTVFKSKDITIHDVYPNPVSDMAFIDYTIHNENVKAKLVIYNILGRNMSEVDMPYSETRIKLQADELATGIYFYTLYLDNNGVLTRKLIVRK